MRNSRKLAWILIVAAPILQISCRVHLPVGQNLQDHVTTLIGPITLAGKSLLIDRDINLDAIRSYSNEGGGPLSSISGVSAVGFISTPRTNPNSSWPNIGYFLSASGVHQKLAEEFTYILGLKPGVLQSLYRPHVGKDANFVLVMLGRPKSRGEIRLASRSPWDKPIIDPKYFSHPEDILSMVDGRLTLINLHMQ